jgi:hypothetical protein
LGLPLSKKLGFFDAKLIANAGKTLQVYNISLSLSPYYIPLNIIKTLEFITALN